MLSQFPESVPHFLALVAQFRHLGMSICCGQLPVHLVFAERFVMSSSKQFEGRIAQFELLLGRPCGLRATGRGHPAHFQLEYYRIILSFYHYSLNSPELHFWMLTFHRLGLLSQPSETVQLTAVFDLKFGYWSEKLHHHHNFEFLIRMSNNLVSWD